MKKYFPKVQRENILERKILRKKTAESPHVDTHRVAPDIS